MSDDKNSKPVPTEHFGILLDEADGARQVVFERDGEVCFGLLRPLEEGKTLDPESEIVEVRNNGPFAILTSHGRVGRATSQGPAMVNSAKFKSNWENIFGKKAHTESVVN